MTVREITENKKQIIEKDIKSQIIFNRFDLRYNDYFLFNINDLYISGHIIKDTMKLSLFYRNVSNETFEALYNYIFTHFAVKYIELENSLFYHRDLQPNYLYFIELESFNNNSSQWLDKAKLKAAEFQKEKGKYSILHTPKPAKDDKTTESDLAIDEPEYKPRLRNMDIVQFRVNDKTEAMLLVSITNENIVFEHITSNPKLSQFYDIELILALEAILYFKAQGCKNIFLKSTTLDLKQRLNANQILTYSGKIWKKSFIHSILHKLAHYSPKVAKAILKYTSNDKVHSLISTITNEQYILSQKKVWFDFYEDKEDANLSDNNYFNHEISKNYISALFSQLPFIKGRAFMDIGCGTGYVLYKMSKRFSRVYGIEIDEKWINIAKDNFNKLDIKNYEILYQDINQVHSEYFDKAEVFYLFNPFIGDTMKQVAQKLSESFKRKKRTGYIIYINALNREFFDKIKTFSIYKEFKHNNRNHVIYKI